MESRPLIGVRHEDKSPWERRAPLSPEHVRKLVDQHRIDVAVVSSSRRVFTDDQYEAAGARIVPSVAACQVVLGVKEIPPCKLIHGMAYLFFAHVIKGQPHNMPLLQKLLDKKCHLIDYEKITDAAGRRLIFFGRYAGLAGMIETLWAFGQRLQSRGLETPFAAVRRPYEYADLAQAKEQLREVGARLRADGVPHELRPLVVGFAGYGNVSQGAQEILDELPLVECSPDQLFGAQLAELPAEDNVIKVVFKEEHMVEPINPRRPFELQDYYDRPDRYMSSFARYLPRLRVLVNCIYWDTPYPHLVSRADVRRLAATDSLAVEVIGDISCDVRGAIELTSRPSTVDHPVYVYDPERGTIRDGVEGPGPVIMAIDNLPCELPADATRSFGDALLPFIPALARTDFDVPRRELELPDELRRGLIVHRGRLTPDYRYLRKFIDAES